MTRHQLAALAFGRILRMAARPVQPGDLAEYDRCRGLILDALEADGQAIDTRPNWTRDRLKGAAGD